LIFPFLNFESVASKWLYNKRFIHINVVTFAACELWINRNNPIFNKVIWINIKQVRSLMYCFLRDWKKPFKELDGGKVGLVMDRLLVKLIKPLCLPVGWFAKVSTGSLPRNLLASRAMEGGHTLKYLTAQAHNVHVVM
jgi:hypothetical protein